MAGIPLCGRHSCTERQTTGSTGPLVEIFVGCTGSQLENSKDDLFVKENLRNIKEDHVTRKEGDRSVAQSSQVRQPNAGEPPVVVRTRSCEKNALVCRQVAGHPISGPVEPVVRAQSCKTMHGEAVRGARTPLG